jgi:mono/diheme cytochrome c family protein
MRVSWVIIGLLFAGCGAGINQPLPAPGNTSTGSEGEALYSRPLETGNTFACSSCHSLREPASDGLRRAGHPLAGVTARASYKNGRVSSLLAAVNSCVTEWMGGEAWLETDEDWRKLRGFLEAQSGDSAEVKIQIVQPPSSLAGDEARGRALFNQTCLVCHGVDAVGTVRAPPLAGTALMPKYIAERIRLSGLPGSAVYPGLTGGRMPFWGADRLTDPELRDLVTYVAGSKRTEADAGTSVDAGVVDAGTPGDCEKSHTRVGWYADLATHYHGVSGRVTIVDDCTLRFSNFYYDGNGIDVRVIGAKAGAYGSGFAMGPQLYNYPVGYKTATLDIRLPDGKTMSDLDGVSVWCVAAKISFGEGMFRGP